MPSPNYPEFPGYEPGSSNPYVQGGGSQGLVGLRAQGQRRRPKPAITARQRQNRRKLRLAREFTELWNSAEYGSAHGLPEGMAVDIPDNWIPYSAIPTQIRERVDAGEIPLGWDPERLTERQRYLLAKMQVMGQREMDQRQQDYQPGESPLQGAAQYDEEREAEMRRRRDAAASRYAARQRQLQRNG